MNYFDELTKAMTLLSKQDNSIFLGQSVEYPGTAVYNIVKHLPTDKRWEMPVTENMQLGMSIGLSLQGYLPISIFPRINFLWSVADQLVNHLDKLHIMSQGEYYPKVIVRTSIGSTVPLDPQEQHKHDTSEALDMLLPHTTLVRLDSTKDIVPQYQKAIDRNGSTILVEWADKYGE